MVVWAALHERLRIFDVVDGHSFWKRHVTGNGSRHAHLITAEVCTRVKRGCTQLSKADARESKEAYNQI